MIKPYLNLILARLPILILKNPIINPDLSAGFVFNPNQYS